MTAIFWLPIESKKLGPSLLLGVSARSRGEFADGVRAWWLRVVKGRKIVIVARVRDRVREKIMSVDRGACFVHRETKQKEPARFETSTHKA